LKTLSTRWGWWIGLGGHLGPAALWSGRLQLERDETERLGFRAA